MLLLFWTPLCAESSGEHQDTLEFWSLFLELVDRSWANLASAVHENKLRRSLTTSQLFRSRGAAFLFVYLFGEDRRVKLPGLEPDQRCPLIFVLIYL